MHNEASGANRFSAPQRLSPLSKTLGWVAVGLILVLGALQTYWGIRRFAFDDAAMYFRYALHIHEGYGAAWDKGGPHVYGLTSLFWLFIVWAGSLATHQFIPLLVCLSAGTGLLAMFILALVIARRSSTPALRDIALVFPLIALPLLLDNRFVYSWKNGMETMAGMLLNTLGIAATLSSVRRPSVAKSILAGAVWSLILITRPEMAIVAIAFPCTAWLWLSSRRSWKYLAIQLLTFLGIGLAFALLSYSYFGTAVPLAFYIKSVGGYKGYTASVNNLEMTTEFISIFLVPLLAAALLIRKKQSYALLAFFVPVGLASLYLLTVLQIMGQHARYFIPLAPFLYIPALGVVDDHLSEERPLRFSPLRMITCLLILLCGGTYPLLLTSEWGLFNRTKSLLYESPRFTPRGPSYCSVMPDPVPGFASYPPFGFAAYAASLPKDTSLALTEVGIVGAVVPDQKILDLAALNDTHMALHGISVDYIFEQHPDVIWMPHPEYTWLYGALPSDPRFLARYEFYPGVFSYGLALRKDGKSFQQIKSRLDQLLMKNHEACTTDDYAAATVSWNPYPKHPHF